MEDYHVHVDGGEEGRQVAKHFELFVSNDNKPSAMLSSEQKETTMII